MERRQDEGFALIHAQGRGLNDQDVLKIIDDEAAEEVALGVDDAEGGGARQMSLAHRQGGPDAILEERLVHFDAVGRQEAHVDLGFGVEETDPEQTLTVVLELYQAPVRGRLGEAQDGGVIDPRVSGHDAVGLARFQQHCRQ